MTYAWGSWGAIMLQKVRHRYARLRSGHESCWEISEERKPGGTGGGAKAVDECHEFSTWTVAPFTKLLSGKIS